MFGRNKQEVTYQLYLLIGVAFYIVIGTAILGVTWLILEKYWYSPVPKSTYLLPTTNLKNEKSVELDNNVISKKCMSSKSDSDNFSIDPIILLFPMNGFSLDKKSIEILEKFFIELNKYPKVNIRIEGHTDQIGNENNNYCLSGRRIGTIISYLQKKGIDMNRIEPLCYGELQPTTKDDTPIAQNKNRRVEIRLSKEY